MATDNGRSHEPPVGLPVTLMDPTLVARPFHREGWIYEEKYDGWRLLGYKSKGRVWLLSRTHRDHTRRVPALAAVIAALTPPAVILDGEVVIFRCAVHLPLGVAPAAGPRGRSDAPDLHGLGRAADGALTTSVASRCAPAAPRWSDSWATRP